MHKQQQTEKNQTKRATCDQGWSQAGFADRVGHAQIRARLVRLKHVTMLAHKGLGHGVRSSWSAGC